MLHGLFEPKTEKLLNAAEVIAQSIVLNTEGRSYLEPYGVADAITTFTLDVSDNNIDWILNWRTWVAVTNIPTGIGWINCFRYIRLRSIAAGVVGDKISLWLLSTR